MTLVVFCLPFFVDVRHGIPALKPAPIVASYLGYPGTTGGNSTDYTIVDSVRTSPTVVAFYTVVSTVAFCTVRCVRADVCFQIASCRVAGAGGGGA